MIFSVFHGMKGFLTGLGKYSASTAPHSHLFRPAHIAASRFRSEKITGMFNAGSAMLSQASSVSFPLISVVPGLTLASLSLQLLLSVT